MRSDAVPNLSPRGRLIRDAIFYTPIFVLCAAVLLLMLVGAIDRAIVGMVLLVVVTFLFGYQSIQTLRDLRDRPQQVEGAITRRWTKRDGFVVKSHYVAVNKAIFRIPVESYLDVKTGDSVRIEAYPHTGLVLQCERTGRPEPEAPAVKSEDQPRAVPATGRMRTLRTARLSPSARERREGGTDAPPPSEKPD
jgi:hypothetical protein